MIPLKPFRRTPGVRFHLFPMEEFPKIGAIDRVIQDGGAGVFRRIKSDEKLGSASLISIPSLQRWY